MNSDIRVGSRYTIMTAIQPMEKLLNENCEDEWFDGACLPSPIVAYAYRSTTYVNVEVPSKKQLL